MTKMVRLAVVGIALSFGIASRLASHARTHQPLVLASTFSNHQLFPHSKLSKQVFNVSQPIGEEFGVRDDQGEMLQILEQDIPNTQDGKRFQHVMQEAIAQNLHQRPIGEIVQSIAQEFLGTPYKAGLLDQFTEETLVATLNQFDCVLFIETVLAIARGIATQDYSYPTFVNHIQNQRYRHGQMDGYCSRLHYFSEWILDNQKRGIVKNLAQDLGSVPLNKTLNFMSTHRQNYSQLSDDVIYQCIVDKETELNSVTVNYIPTNRIRQLYSQLQPGDIIAVATKIPGLDVTHTGFVYRTAEGNIGFIHASPIGRVTISRDLQQYVSKVENAIGILVARPNDLR